jgi:hypothetical protein
MSLPWRDGDHVRRLARTPSATSSNFVQLAQNVAILTVVSVGTTFVIVTAGVDLSIPSGIILGEVLRREGARHDRAPGTGLDRGRLSPTEQTTASYMLVRRSGAGPCWPACCSGLVNGIAIGYLGIPPAAGHAWARSAPASASPAAAERRQHRDVRAQPDRPPAASSPACRTSVLIGLVSSGSAPSCCTCRCSAAHLRDRLERRGRPPGGHQGEPHLMLATSSVA